VAIPEGGDRVRFESIGLGSVEVDISALARLLAEMHPGGVEQSRAWAEALLAGAELARTLLPMLIRAQGEIIRGAAPAGDEPIGSSNRRRGGA
jgi:hypothetical protein